VRTNGGEKMMLSLNKILQDLHFEQVYVEDELFYNKKILKIERQAQKKSINQIKKETGLSRITITKAEVDYKFVSKDKLIKYVEYLKLDKELFFI